MRSRVLNCFGYGIAFLAGVVSTWFIGQKVWSDFSNVELMTLWSGEVRANIKVLRQLDHGDIATARRVLLEKLRNDQDAVLSLMPFVEMRSGWQNALEESREYLAAVGVQRVSGSEKKPEKAENIKDLERERGQPPTIKKRGVSGSDD